MFIAVIIIIIMIIIIINNYMTSEVLTVVSEKITIWNKMAYDLRSRYKRFGRSVTSVFHPEDDDSLFLRKVGTCLAKYAGHVQENVKFRSQMIMGSNGNVFKRLDSSQTFEARYVTKYRRGMYCLSALVSLLLVCGVTAVMREAER
jgi:hypothetical protein